MAGGTFEARLGTFACLTTGCQGLALERVRYHSPGDGYGCVPVWRSDRDHADDLVRQWALMMLTDLLHSARSAAAANAPGSGRELPSHPTVTVMS